MTLTSATCDRPETKTIRSGNKFVFRTVRSTQELIASFQLIQSCYQRAGLAESSAAMRVTEHHLRESTQVFVAVDGDQVVGTVSLFIGDLDSLPISADHSFGNVEGVNCFQRSGEISSFAISSDCVRGREVMVGLVETLVAFSRMNGLERLFAIAHPSHARLYRRVTGANSVGTAKPCQFVLGSPGVPLTWRVEPREVFDDQFGRRFCGGKFGDTALERSRLKRRPMSERERSYFSWFLVNAEHHEMQDAAVAA